MTLTTIGDQSQQFMTRRLVAMLRGDIGRLTQEVGSGKRQEIGAPVSGDSARVLALRRDMTAAGVWQTAVAEARLATGTAQAALGQVEKAASDAGPGLVAAALSRSSSEIGAAAADARARFATVVEALNAEVTGASLFAGTANDGLALNGAAQILAGAEAAITGETTAAGVRNALEDWFFGAGGGFEVTAWRGNTSATNYRIGGREDVSTNVTAADPAFRQVLMGLALAALAPGLADVPEQAALMQQAGTTLIDASARVIGVRADLGAVEARIEQRSVRLSAEVSALQLAEADLLAVDPYEAAVALETTANRLEALYTITARLSRLNLSEYLR